MQAGVLSVMPLNYMKSKGKFDSTGRKFTLSGET